MSPEKQADIVNSIYDNYKSYASSKVRREMQQNRN
jgi:hypothetical protein